MRQILWKTQLQGQGKLVVVCPGEFNSVLKKMGDGAYSPLCRVGKPIV
jgi:hypothetical protein